MLLSTLLVGNTLVNFGIATLGYIVLSSFFPRYGATISVALMTFLLLLLGEVTPKRLALRYAERVAPTAARLLLFWMALLRPFNLLLHAGSDVFKSLFDPERKSLSDDELLTVVELGEQQGQIDTEEAEMVDGIMRLSELKASDEMIPRVDIVGLDLDGIPLQEHIRTARRAHVRYLPAYNRTPDRIVGIVNTALFLLDPEHDIHAALSDATFVPENMPLDELLVLMQKENLHLVILVDEYGGTAGLITRGDILELISDPVPDPTDDYDAEINRISENSWWIRGTVSLEEINHETGLELEADDSDRIAGWVSYHAESLPAKGLVVEEQGCRVTVTGVRRNRITGVLLERLPPPPDEAGDLAEEFSEATENLLENDPSDD